MRALHGFDHPENANKNAEIDQVPFERKETWTISAMLLQRGPSDQKTGERLRRASLPLF
ncbi:hypothetical protein [Azospirillum agricola]|uniref:hypothetical protein n=1 Tax=Azospirillum agricola TaxID=1720247 RepID=UPI0015C4D7E6|nr:hypothetical protein [Azospirillum agricola]